MSQHARFAPSSANEWGNCSGSIIAQQSAPNLNTKATDEGNAQHWVAEQCLRQGIAPGYFIGHTAPNGIVITDEMVDAVRVVVDDVIEICKKYNARQLLVLEHVVFMPEIHPTDCWGTLDAALDLRPLGVPIIYLWDFKFGHGIVYAKENLQAVSYLEGLRNELGIDGAEDQLITVHVRIVQPNAFRSTGPIDEWVIKLSDIRGHVNKLHTQAMEADTNPQMCAGKHCHYCSAVTRCPSAKQATYSLIDRGKQPLNIETYNNLDLAIEYSNLQEGLTLVKARFEAIEAELENRIKSGGTGTGYSIETGSGRSKWTIPVQQAVMIGKQFGVDLSKEDVKTPTQAAQLVPVEMRDQFKEVLKSVTIRHAGSAKLVPSGEGRLSRAFKPKET